MFHPIHLDSWLQYHRRIFKI